MPGPEKFSHPLFGAVPQSACRALHAEARRLLGLLPEGSGGARAGAMARLDALCGGEAEAAAGPAEADRADQLRRVRHLQPDGQVDRLRIAQAVAARAPGRGVEAGPDRLGAWVLAAMLQRLEGDPAENRIFAAADGYRRLRTKRPEVLDGIGAGAARDFPAVLETLVAAREGMPSAEGPAGSPRRWLGALCTLFDGVVHDRAAIHRRFEGGPGRVVLRRTSAGGPEDVLEWGDDLGPEAEDGLGTPGATAAADAPRDTRHVTRPGKSFDALVQDRVWTATAAAVTATRGLALPAEHDVLTGHEARVLLGAARGSPGDPGLQAAALSLIYGRSVDRLLSAFGSAGEGLVIEDGDSDDDCVAGPEESGEWVKVGETVVLEAAVHLPPFKIGAQEAADLGLASDGTERFRLGCPAGFAPGTLLGLAPGMADLSLRRLRDRVARPYARGRVSGWLAAWLRRAGADAAVSGALCGHDSGNHAQMHYTALSTDLLLGWWERALREGLGLAPPERVPQPAPVVGSRARLPRELLRLAFGELAQDIAELGALCRDGQRPGLAAAAEAHNLFATYTLELLMFATGHRPVGAPFERAGDYDLPTAVMWISDKATRGGPSSRLVALPPAAVEQLRHWEAHLGALAEMLSPLCPGLVRDRLAPLLKQRSGGSPPPLFFFLDGTGQVVEPDHAAILKHRATVLPVQDNAARHLLRSHLVTAGVAPNAIDAAFGHARLGEEALSASSAFRIRELRAVAGAAQDLLGELGLAPLRSPL